MIAWLEEGLRCSLRQGGVAFPSTARLCSWRECLAKVTQNKTLCIVQSEFLSFFTEIKRHYSMGRDIGGEGFVTNPGDGYRLRLAKFNPEIGD